LNILVCPDSFKDSISSNEFCALAKEVLSKRFPSANIVTRPLADGGENTLECLFPYLWNAEIKWVETVDPLLRPIKASYIVYQGTAYVELASSSGLTLIDEHLRDVMHSTTYGTGILIKHAIDHGYKKVLLFVGGSATNDGGVGIAHALGIQFYDYDGFAIVPNPSNLHKITEIENNYQYADVEFTVATDVKNKLLGDDGAAYTFARQKGASEKDIDLLEEALRHYALLIETLSGSEINNLEGVGAAGGTALSIVGLFNGKIISATDLIMDLFDMKAEIQDANYIITGEGRFDHQSLSGKIVGKIIMESIKLKKNCIIVAGYRLLSMVNKKVTYYNLKKDNQTIEESMRKSHMQLKRLLSEIQFEEP
jgi:glycerate 2-kinase